MSAWTVIITGSRGGMMGMFAFLMITGWRSKYRVLSLSASAVAILIVIVLMPEQYQNRLFSLANMFGHDDTGAAESAVGRIEGIVTGLRLFLERPLTGVGIGAFGRAHYIVDGIGTEAHSLIGQVFGELGLLGVIAFITYTVANTKFMKKIVALYRERNWSEDFILVTTRALQTALIILFVQGLSGHNLFRYNWYIFACFVSISTILVGARAQAEPRSVEATNSASPPESQPV